MGIFLLHFALKKKEDVYFVVSAQVCFGWLPVRMCTFIRGVGACLGRSLFPSWKVELNLHNFCLFLVAASRILCK